MIHKSLTACASGIAFALVAATGAQAQTCTQDEETGEVECSEHDGSMDVTAEGRDLGGSQDSDTIVSGDASPADAPEDDDEVQDDEDEG